MPKHGHIRHGSLQIYPRSRAQKLLPRVRWNSLILNSKPKESGMVGFIGYKAGMMSAYVKDDTPHSHTKGQRVTIPVTIIECPTLRILSVRFYKNNKPISEVLNSQLDKELKKKLKIPKNYSKKLDAFEKELSGKYDDIRVVCYTQVKKTSIKKTPDIAEIGISGNVSEKLQFVKSHFNNDISVKDIIKSEIVDVRGVTKGKGWQGPVKRFGLALRQHKAEKGVRFHGSGGAWHPARVEFTQPMAGQMGYFTRVEYNKKVVYIGKADDDFNKNLEFKNFGKIKNDYIVLRGSVQGPVKRQLLITYPLRATKDQTKKKYEFLELR